MPHFTERKAEKACVKGLKGKQIYSLPCLSELKEKRSFLKKENATFFKKEVRGSITANSSILHDFQNFK